MRRVTAAALAEFGRLKVASLVKPFHPASSPFLSGDTFRSLSHVQIDAFTSAKDVQLKIKELLKYQNESTLRLFIDLHVLQNEQSISIFIEALSIPDFETRSKTLLVFHNHDKLPSLDFFAQLASLGYRSYSVNIVVPVDYVHPLPIGLENRWRLNNGRIRPFNRAQGKPRGERSQLIFAAFNIGTNVPERAKARASCVAAGTPVIETRLSPRHHRNHLLNSYFVISPPGNGFDCHRTWEAIYLGCVPVVLRSALAEEFTSNLPILAVNHWDEFFNASEEKMLETYARLQQRSCELAFEGAWRQRLHIAPIN